MFLILVGCGKEDIVQPVDDYLELIYPAGNEYFSTEDTIPIVWESNLSEPIKIEFSSNLGINWITVEDSLVNKSRIFFWRTPNLISENCLIKISSSSLIDSLENPFNLNISDYKSKSLNYYPLSLGNQWVYLHIGIGSPTPYFYRTVIGDTIINKKRFFIIKSEFPNHNEYYDYETIDTLSGNVIRYRNDEEIIDNLYAKIGDKISSIRYYGTDVATLFEKEEIIFVWSSSRNSRTYFNDGFPSTFRYNLIEGIGLYISNIRSHMLGVTYDSLKACRINSIIYGDSTLLQ